jgi:hypothetical protein
VKLYSDETTQQICETRFARGIPPPISVAAHEKMRVLLAATCLQDVSVLGKIWRWKSLPGRYGLQVKAKWFITYQWIETVGARDLLLERR